MKYLVSFLIFIQSSFYFSQNILPNKSTKNEISVEAIANYKNNFNTRSSNVITTQPIGNLRTMAEWEEVQAICITWTGYKSILAKIVEEVQNKKLIWKVLSPLQVKRNEDSPTLDRNT